MVTIPEKIRESVLLLDLKKPGWWKKIDIEKLNMENGSTCVLGQLFGENTYAENKKKLGLKLGDYPGQFSMHDADWKFLIKSRQEEDKSTKSFRDVMQNGGYSGKEIKHSGFGKGVYWVYDNVHYEFRWYDDTKVSIGSDICLAWMSQNEWSFYEPPIHLKDVKIGQKFKFVHGNGEGTRIELKNQKGYGFMDEENGVTILHDGNDEVTIVE